MLTKLKGAAALLIVAGLLVTLSDKWGSLNSQEGEQRDRVQRPSKTFDDRRKHTIKLEVRYRPARQLSITWAIGEEGDRNYRFKGDLPRWEETRTDVWDGTVAMVAADNFDQGGYLYCAIEQDGVIMREYKNEHTEHNDSCDLTFAAGGR